MRLLALFILFTAALRSAAADGDLLATLRPGHPRLLLTESQLAANVAAAKTDPLRAQLHRHIVAVAEQQWAEPPIERVLIGPRLLDQSRKAIGFVLTNAMAYRLNHDRRYADFAIGQMLRAAAFTDWNPSHFLDVAEMATALALGYDWLYAELTPDQRSTIEQALSEKCLAFAHPAYERTDPKRESFPFVGNNLTNNWNQVCNGGFVLAALALADRDPAMARYVLAGARETLPHAMAAYDPDGAYPEGPVYWGYGTRYNVYLLAALQTALGTDLGLGARPSFDRTVLYRLQVTSPLNLSFNYADGSPNLGGDVAVTWLAQHYGHTYAAVSSRAWLADFLKQPPDRETGRFLALHALWFPAPLTADTPRPALAVCYRGPSQLAVFRTAWDDPRALWTGLKAGSNSVNHGHLDLGSFLLDADGVRWAVDLGPDDYNLPGYWESARKDSPRWRYYRLNNLSHNTITPAQELQEPQANGDIVAFSDHPERSFAVADLSAAYPGKMRSWRRGLAMLERAKVLVQDELTELKPDTPLSWQMLTGTQIEIINEHQAVLRQNGRALKVQLLEPTSARFFTHPAKPTTSAEKPNDGITALVATVPATAQTRDVRVVVLFSPQGDRWSQTSAPPPIQALANWK